MYLGRYTYILCIFKRVITNSHRFSFNCSWRSSSCSHLYTSNSHTCRSIGACWQFANHYLHCLILSRHKQLLLFLCAAYLHFVAFSTARVPCAVCRRLLLLRPRPRFTRPPFPLRCSSSTFGALSCHVVFDDISVIHYWFLCCLWTFPDSTFAAF